MGSVHRPASLSTVTNAHKGKCPVAKKDQPTSQAGGRGSCLHINGSAPDLTNTEAYVQRVWKSRLILSLGTLSLLLQRSNRITP